MDEDGTAGRECLGADYEHVDAVVAVYVDKALLDRRAVSVKRGIENRRFTRGAQAEGGAGPLGRKTPFNTGLHQRVERMLALGAGHRLDGDLHALFEADPLDGGNRVGEAPQFPDRHLMKLT